MRSFWLASLFLAIAAAPALGHAQAPVRATPTSKAQVQLSFSAVAARDSTAVVNV